MLLIAIYAPTTSPLSIEIWRLITHANAKSKSEKSPPPHEDGTLARLSFGFIT
ncbi:hypothetical protein AAZX31_04G075900 [Glycine max]|nr:hypothetical protein JHK85_009625 [Glycine max]KAG5065637.1 hypothetical protein JHK86_009368 [Glycine max]KHN10250.1 hypothetical protein glysoja_017854 [Glycine soja]